MALIFERNNSVLAFERLDSDSEMEIEIMTDNKDISFYLNISEIKELNKHLESLLNE